jgi:hypothetical protein
MNIYQETYSKEFIAQLPVNFEYYKNLDLSTIPSKYHELFVTDWNWGRYSNMKLSDRTYLNELFREYNSTYFKNKD